MYTSDSEKFKNNPTRIFYNYFYPKLKNGDIERAKFFENMGVGISPSNQMQFFTGLKNGHKSITLEHISAAWDHYQVAPNYLFGVSAEPVSMVAEPDQVYKKGVRQDIAKIRKALDELEKKIDNQ